MGGHSAWKKRVAEGRLAKEGCGGAIARHRPRFGRMGIVRPNKKDATTNPKKQKSGRRAAAAAATPIGGGSGTKMSRPASTPSSSSGSGMSPQQIDRARQIIYKWALVTVSALIYLIMKRHYQKKHSEDEFPEI